MKIMKNSVGSNFELRQLFHKDTSTFTYLIFDSETKEGIIIDPVREKCFEILKYIGELEIVLRYIIDTHVHADHVTASGDLKNATGAKIVIGKISGIECADILIKDGDELNFGRFRLKAISTPGHTDSCTSFFTEGKLFSGDTLLIRSCGRTDFQNGDPVKLYDSIMKKLYILPEKTLVFPGHDYLGRTVSSIREEKKFNTRISREITLEEFSQIMNSLDLPKPKMIKEAVKMNLKCGFLNKKN
tara:strand:- start:2784 stop:3515 length:732 start_codon:yes stop_codon:yes gene_type:complete